MNSNIDIDSIRKASVSRRGGVRTRGGRLPPIRIGNIPGLVIGSSNKKVFVPKIPQRRVPVKEEIVEPVPQPTNRKPIKENSKERGRGRGKVFLQTEGSFLGEGPALKVKKELRGPMYDRTSYISDSLRRKTTSLREIDSSIIEELLKPYDEEEFYDSPFHPVKFPLIKKEKEYGELKVSIKKEEIDSKDHLENLTVNIKQEIIDTEMKPFIKQEPKDDYELDSIAEKDSSLKIGFNFERDLKDFKLFHEENKLILLQLPTCLPFIKSSINEEQPEKKKSLVKEESNIASIRDLGEGRIGKLQILKSGQMRVIFGSTAFVLEEEVDSKSLWEAASISIEDGCKGSLVMLGKVKCVMTLQPVLQFHLQ